jgi:hypothetical protein
MCKCFLKKYQEYRKARYLHEDIFKMTQREEKILEYYVEIFQYNLQRSKKNKLDPNILLIIFVQGIRDECIDLLNLMGHGDVSQLIYQKFVICVSATLEVKLNLVRDLEMLFLKTINQQQEE